MNIIPAIYDKIELYYIISKKHIVTYYNHYLSKFIGFQELKIFSNNNIISIFLRYILYCWFTKFILFMKYIRSFIDINTDHLHVIKLNPNNKNAIILNKESINFKQLTKTLNRVEDDNKMLDVVLLKFELVNGETTTCLKNLIVKYKDTYTNYQNTLKNILIFNDINYDDQTTLNIKMLRNKKMVNINTLLVDTHNYHINHILYFL